MQIWLQGECALECFDREIEIRFFHNEKAAQNCLFLLQGFFLLSMYSHQFLNKIEQLLPQSHKPTLSVLTSMSYVRPMLLLRFAFGGVAVTLIGPAVSCMLCLFGR